MKGGLESRESGALEASWRLPLESFKAPNAFRQWHWGGDQGINAQDD